MFPQYELPNPHSKLENKFHLVTNSCSCFPPLVVLYKSLIFKHHQHGSDVVINHISTEHIHISHNHINFKNYYITNISQFQGTHSQHAQLVTTTTTTTTTKHIVIF